MTSNIRHKKLSAGSRPDSLAKLPMEAEAMIPIQRSNNQKRTVKNCPAASRFFQSNAIAGVPDGCNSKGGRLDFLGFWPDGKRPARAAATRSAILRDRSP